PIVKTEADRQALLNAATSGNPRFFLGTDSAPHARGDKEAAVGKAGIYSAGFAMSLYAEAFASVGRLDRLEGFASFFGSDFYRLPRHSTAIVLEKEVGRQIPVLLDYHDRKLVPLRGGEIPAWQVTGFTSPEQTG
ncbi:MAG: dihydroorotase, partial [bacterium]